MSHVPYASVVGSLMYEMFCTRLDIAHAVGVLSGYMSKIGKGHCATIKRIFRYLRGTTTYGLCYQGRPGHTWLVGHTWLCGCRLGWRSRS
jgi:hypothetical protein